MAQTCTYMFFEKWTHFDLYKHVQTCIYNVHWCSYMFITYSICSYMSVNVCTSDIRHLSVYVLWCTRLISAFSFAWLAWLLPGVTPIQAHEFNRHQDPWGFRPDLAPPFPGGPEAGSDAVGRRSWRLLPRRSTCCSACCIDCGCGAARHSPRRECQASRRVSGFLFGLE